MMMDPVKAAPRKFAVARKRPKLKPEATENSKWITAQPETASKSKQLRKTSPSIIPKQQTLPTRELNSKSSQKKRSLDLPSTSNTTRKKGSSPASIRKYDSLSDYKIPKKRACIAACAPAENKGGRTAVPELTVRNNEPKQRDCQDCTKKSDSKKTLPNLNVKAKSKLNSNKKTSKGRQANPVITESISALRSRSSSSAQMISQQHGGRRPNNVEVGTTSHKLGANSAKYHDGRTSCNKPKSAQMPAAKSHQIDTEDTKELASNNARLESFDLNRTNCNVGNLAAEAMDFENPLPAILQMVADGSHHTLSHACAYPTDAMEVDIDAQPLERKQLVIIPDTNVWISNRFLLDQLLETEFTPGGVPVLVIPWMVLQEIDHNMHRHQAANSRPEFRNAAKYIHSLLSTKHPKVRGQKAAEAIMEMEFNELMADDSILNCALSHNKMPQFSTVFITNDVNLLNKALVNDLKAFKADQELIRNIRSLISEAKNTDSPFGSSLDQNLSFSVFPSSEFYSSNSTQTLNLPTPMKLERHKNEKRSSLAVGAKNNQTEEFSLQMDVDDPMEGQSSTYNAVLNQETPTFETVVVSLKQTLTYIIVPKMVEDYGVENWKFAIKIQPPFTVETALKCIQVHWLAVFSFVFRPRAKDVIDELLETFKKPPGQSNGELLEWRVTICKLAGVLLSMSDLAKKSRVLDTRRILENFIKATST